MPSRSAAAVFTVIGALAGAPALNAARATVSGELRQWHRITITFDGPELAEDSQPNPFRDYRLTVTFSQGSRSFDVPGYYAADGNAAESGASRGDKWRVHFVPDQTGSWNYRTSFRNGADIAVSLDPGAGEAGLIDGISGRFDVASSDKKKPDLRAQGLLRYTGGRYLRFAGTGEYFLKGGADSPENWLAYCDFDQTPERKDLEQRPGEARQAVIHRYEPHTRDWRKGDPSWRGSKGRGIIGALNYLAGKGMNSVYFLTMNVAGDGDDVWPWTSKTERHRFDCSKLDQWEIVFSHMERLGIMLHILTQETENDQLLDGGELGLERKLYYRELIARFGHHLALVWNLGEENTNTTQQLKAFCSYFQALDAYDHPIVVHTYPGQYEKVYAPLLGFGGLEGPSLQMGDMKQTHAETIRWIDKSSDAGRPWVVFLDEIGPSDSGVKPDADDPDHAEVRHHALWGGLMAGGAGVEWYFGYKFAHNDLNCEDWRSRDRMWDQTRHALEFFRRYLPFPEMKHADNLATAEGAFCLAKAGEVYAIYLPAGGTSAIQLDSGRYEIRWYNPRTGGELQSGSVALADGPGVRPVGLPPADPDKDWVVLLRR